MKTIEDALRSAGLVQRTPPPPGGEGRADRGTVLDGVPYEVERAQDADGPAVSPPPARSRAPVLPGEFASRSFRNAAGSRAYKLYVPSTYQSTGDPVPVLVMLHGCTQSPDDFAAGTRMNALAERHGFLVIYPAQAAKANGSRCWNWFRPQDQRRDSGEPSLIAGITKDVVTSYNVDDRRIFVAGLSAGGAMAVILGRTYPDLFAAVGVHSGLPYGVAHDVPSAFGAMKNPGQRAHPPGHPGARANMPAVPTIVFHGTADETVDPGNGKSIVQHAAQELADDPGLQKSVHEATAAGGVRYTRTVYVDGIDHPLVEYWVLHGGRHAWSGGSAGGSFTDPSGPDASAEMVRFFLLQQRSGRA